MRPHSGPSDVVELRPRSLVFRERFASRGVVLPLIAFALLATQLVLWLLDVWHAAWEKLVVIAFLFGAAGVSASAVAMREPRLRAAGRRGMLLSAVAVLCAFAVAPLLTWVVRSGRRP